MGRNLFPSLEKSKAVEPKNTQEKRLPLYRTDTLNLSEYFITRQNSTRKSKSKFKKSRDNSNASSTPLPNVSIAPVQSPLSVTLESRRSSVSSIDFSFSNQQAWAPKSLINRLKDDDTISVTSTSDSTYLSEDESLFLETCSMRSDLTTSSRIHGICAGPKLSCPNPLECYKYAPKLHSCHYCKSGPMESTIYLRHLKRINHRANKSKVESSYSEGKYLERNTRCITFTGFLRDTPQEGFCSHLYSFGMVDYTFIGMEEDSLDEPTLIVEMDTVEDAMDALKFSNLHFCGFRLKPRKLEIEDEFPSEVWAVQQLKRTLTTFNETKTESRESILEQLPIQTKMTSAEVETKHGIVSDLQKYLRKFYPEARCEMFGSTATGLGLSGSNLDIHVDVGHETLCQRVQGLQMLLEGKFAREVAEHLEVNTQVIKVTHSTVSRQPSVSYIDVMSRTRVDLVFGNNQVLLSTSLIKRYLASHPVVRPYLNLIHLWALGNDLTNPKKPTTHLSSYALTLMALFFLMRKLEAGGGRPKPILPFVNQLVKGGRVQVDDPPLDCGCCSLLSPCHPEVSCSLHPVQLVIEFLKFYSTFKFDSFAICPASGKMVPKLAFLRQFPSFKTNAIAVQDPFMLNNNLTENFMMKPLIRFRDLCALGHQALDDVMSGGGDPFTCFMPSHLTELEDLDTSTYKPTDEEIHEEINRLFEELKGNKATQSLYSTEGTWL